MKSAASPEARRARRFAGLAVAGLLLAPSPSPAATALCAVPPGPPGEVRCTRDDIALCEATGRSTFGQCLERPRGGGAGGGKAVVLKTVLGRSPSGVELASFQDQLSQGRILRNGSVFTFDLGEDAALPETVAAAAELSAPWVLWGLVVLAGGALLFFKFFTIRRRSRGSKGRAAGGGAG